ASARIPRFKNGVGMLRGPVHCESRSIHQNRDQRLASSGNGLQHLHLHIRKIDRGAIAARKSWNVNRHLFSFQSRRDSYECDDGIGLLRGVHGLLTERVHRRLPVEADAGARQRSLVRVFHAKFVRLGIRKMQAKLRWILVLLFVMGGTRQYLLAIHPDTVTFDVSAGIALNQLHLKSKIPGGWRCESSGPANRKRLPWNAVGIRTRAVPVAVYVV